MINGYITIDIILHFISARLVHLGIRQLRDRYDGLKWHQVTNYRHLYRDLGVHIDIAGLPNLRYTNLCGIVVVRIQLGGMTFGESV